MKLYELHNTEKPSSGTGLVTNQIYTYNPKIVNDKNGHPQSLLTVYSFFKGRSGKKTYAMYNQAPIKVKILNTENLDDTSDNVMRVRILSNVDQIVARYSHVNNDFTKNEDGDRITFTLKDLPDFDNYSKYTDEEFYEKFGRVKLNEDHGLVGYLYIENEIEEVNTHRTEEKKEVEEKEDKPKKHEEEKTSSKLDNAIVIYRASKNQGRKLVIQKMKLQLGMTQAGASSYYTKAKNAVENS